jgi:phospholipase/carboxylesterase
VSGQLDLLEHQVRPAGGDPQGALVLLHGRGTDEFDLLPLLDELDPERRLVGLTPRAPLQLPPGGFHWYVSRAVGYPDHDTFHQTLDILTRWLDALPEALGVPRSQTVLGGFSMGAVMSYAAGLGAGRTAPRGLVALSGFMPTVDGFQLDLEHRDGFPVAIGHGIQDPVISVQFAREARRRLEQAGAQVLYRESPMFHSVDPMFLQALAPWVAELLDLSGKDRSAQES